MGWRTSDLTARTGAPLAVTDPFGYEFAQERTRHVIYLGGGKPWFYEPPRQRTVLGWGRLAP